MKKKTVKKWLHSKHLNRHHVLPSSKGGTNNPNNIAIVDIEKHREFHRLFANKTPEETIEYLVEYFWKGNWGFVVEALTKGEQNGKGYQKKDRTLCV